MIHLLGTRRFAPLFWVQSLGAFNDNVFKNALVMLITYRTAVEQGWDADVMVPMLSAIFLLPYVLFGSIAGQLCDRYDKTMVTRWVKFIEILIMVVAAYGFITNRPILLMVGLFAMGTHSTFFGPIKYGILPQHLKPKELMGGAGLVEASTFLAILTGTICGGQMLVQSGESYIMDHRLSYVLLGVAVLGWIGSLAMPRAAAADPTLAVDLNLWRGTRTILREAKRQTRVWRTILGLSWFWTMGAIWLSILPVYVKDTLHGGPGMVTIFLTMFSVGIGLGALAASMLNHAEISAKWVPLAGFGMSAFTIVFVGLQSWVVPGEFSVLSPVGIGIALSLVGVAFCGGLFSTPLYAGMQAWSDPDHRSRNVAANNIVNSFWTVGGSVLVAVLAVVGLSLEVRLILIALINLGVSFYIVTLVPESVVHTVLRWALRGLFRVEVRGLENYKAGRERKVIICNHVSYLDAVVLTAFLPEVPTFAIDTRIAQAWWVKPFLNVIRAFAIDPTKPMAIKSLTKLVQQGVPVVIFPEGRLTVTGGLMKMYQGPGTMAIHGDADLVPVWLDGVQHSVFSMLQGKKRLRWFPKITMTILPPVTLATPEGTGRQARATVVAKIYELMTEMGYAASTTRTTLLDALVNAGERHGWEREAINDVKLKPVSYRELVARSRVLGPKLVHSMPETGVVGLLLPNSTAVVTAFFALQAEKRVAALLNFSIGARNLRSACATALIRRVWTSEEFVRVGKLQPLIESLQEDGVEVCYLESLARNRTWRDVMRYTWFRRYPGGGLPTEAENVAQSEQPAAILFTSGSSGAPKGVVLSHRNLLSNQSQLVSRIDFNAQDRVFNCLPVFHSFGLTGGTLAPLLAGVRVFLYPSPLHYGIIPEMVYQTNSTILFGTNTFLTGYSRKAHPYDFYSVRYVFAGAEKIKEITKRLWADAFGIRILEGYGSTECSPVIATNTPMYQRSETVGKFLPGLEWRLEPVPGITGAGRLWVKGANVMLGYYLPEKPGVLQPPTDGWYDTGDIVEVSPDGFVSIKGRAKRFAKVAGEMVSLSAVEDLVAQAYPGVVSASVAVPHDSKGEEVVLVTEREDVTRESLQAKAQELGVTSLGVPARILRMKVPLLATGKTDYVALQEMVERK